MTTGNQKNFDHLTGKQRLFCEEYTKDLNASQAAIRAGYSEKTAYSIGQENLNKPEIQEYLSHLMGERAKNVQIDAQYVLQRLKEIDELDVADILEDDLTIKPLSKWPKVWRTSLSGIDIVALTSSDDSTSLIKKIKWPDKVKNLELIGRHIDVKAFEKESAPVTGVLHIMPVPTAASVEDWEAQAKLNQDPNAV